MCGCEGATVNKCATQNKKADLIACSSSLFPQITEDTVAQ